MRNDIYFKIGDLIGKIITAASGAYMFGLWQNNAYAGVFCFVFLYNLTERRS